MAIQFRDGVWVDAATGEIFGPPGSLDPYGHELPDPTPLRLPSGFRRPETLQEQVARLVRTQISREAEEAGYETFEEAEDFDVDDDFDPSSPFETIFDPVLGEVTPHDLKTFESEYRRKFIGLQQKFFEQEEKAGDIARKMKALIEGAKVSPMVRQPAGDPPRRGEPRRQGPAEPEPADE